MLALEAEDDVFHRCLAPTMIIITKMVSKNGQITATKIFQNKNGAGCYCLSSSAAERLLLDAKREVFNLTDAFIWNRTWAEFLQIEPAPATK